jgi:hypothetical protein
MNIVVLLVSLIAHCSAHLLLPRSIAGEVLANKSLDLFVVEKYLQ